METGWEGSKPRSSETNGVSAAATHDRKGHGGSKTTQSGAMITTGNGGGVGA